MSVILINILIGLLTGLVSSITVSIVLLNTVDSEFKSKKLIKRAWSKAITNIKTGYPELKLSCSFRKLSKKIVNWNEFRQLVIKNYNIGNCIDFDKMGIEIKHRSNNTISPSVQSVFWKVFTKNITNQVNIQNNDMFYSAIEENVVGE